MTSGWHKKDLIGGETIVFLGVGGLGPCARKVHAPLQRHRRPVGSGETQHRRRRRNDHRQRVRHAVIPVPVTYLMTTIQINSILINQLEKY